MNIKPEEITAIIRKQIEDYHVETNVDDVGTVLEVGDGIAHIYGLDKAMSGELLELPHGVYGLALNLEEDNVGAVLLGEDDLIKEGDTVRRTGRVMRVPVGDAMVGRVVNPLGIPIDGKGEIRTTESRLIEVKAPGIADRQPVKVPLQTGIKAIDSMVPIGRGQRELINGYRHRYDHQSERQRRNLRICCHRSESVHCVARCPYPGRTRRHGIYHRCRRNRCRRCAAAVPGPVCRRFHG